MLAVGPGSSCCGRRRRLSGWLAGWEGGCRAEALMLLLLLLHRTKGVHTASVSTAPAASGALLQTDHKRLCTRRQEASLHVGATPLDRISRWHVSSWPGYL